MCDDDNGAIQRARAMGANSCHAGMKPVDHPTVLYCTACGTRLMEIEAGGQRTRQIYGRCDCSWRCCDATRAEVHNVHMAYREYEPGEERMPWYVHLFIWPTDRRPCVRIDNQPDKWAIQPIPTAGPFKTRDEARDYSTRIYAMDE